MDNAIVPGVVTVADATTVSPAMIAGDAAKELVPEFPPPLNLMMVLAGVMAWLGTLISYHTFPT